ncbi:IS66 family transposase, partial [Azohydromonas australica]|uniref:IS66 family transposase n=1 Tax=Azohydromonas australica TaxID=364039 RepID=UPI003F8B2FB9
MAVCRASSPPPRRRVLIPRGKLGVSVWVHLLLGKYLHGQPLHRLLQDWEDQGLHLSPGTLTDGLHRLAPMFEPLQQALLEHLRGQNHWHADETRWEVFVEREGKRGHRWYLWMFPTPTVAYYTLDPSRSSKVPKQVLAGCDEGILSVDRYSAYKGYVNKHPGVQLSFCWAHQRRDFLRVANSHPQLEPWAMSWVDRIGELYKLHARRQEAGLASAEFNVRDQQLRQAVQSMCQSCEQSLAEGRLAAPVLKVLQSLHNHWQGLILFVEQPWLPLGRVEMWRGGRRSGLSISAPFVWRCPSNLAIAPFPHPPRRTGRADLPHPALFRRIRPSLSSGRVESAAGISVPTSSRGTGRSIGGTPFPACRFVFAARSADAVRCSRRWTGKFP